MKKMRRLLAALLVTTLLFGSNGFSYAAEAASEGTEEAVQETVALEEQESETTEETAPDETTVEDSSVQETVKSEESETDADFAEESAEAEEPAGTEEEGEAAEAVTDDTEASGTDETEPADEAAAEEQVFTEGTLIFNGDEHDCDYSVTLTYDASAEIPEGAELSVREIEKGTEEYAAYLADANSAVANSVTDARFFDIKILANGGEIHPKSPVKVSISYKEAIEVEEKAQVEAVHFDEKKEEPVPVEVETNDETKVDEVAFEAESFSVYAVLYTVDFKFKDYAFSMPGESSILLSEVASRLGFYSESETREFSVQDVSNVTFSSNDLIKTEKQEDGDWLLTSLKAFSTKETLTIDMVNGDQFVVDVTDAQDGVYEYKIEESAGNAIELGSEYESNWYLLSTLTTADGAKYYYVTPVSLNGSTSINGSINSFYNTADINNITHVQIGNESAAPSWAGVTSHTYQSGDSVTSELIHVSNAADNYYKIVNGDNNNREAFGNESVLCKYEITSTDSEGVGSIKLGTLPDLKLQTVFKDSSGEVISGSLPSDYKLLIKMVRDGNTYYALQPVDASKNPSDPSEPLKFYKYTEQWGQGKIGTDPYYYSGNGSETISTQVVTGADSLTADLILHRVPGAVFYNENTIGGTQGSDLTKDLFSTSSEINKTGDANLMTTTFEKQKDDGVDHEINVNFYKEHKPNVSDAEPKTGNNLNTAENAYFFRVRLYNEGKLVAYKIVPVTTAEAGMANSTGKFTHTIAANEEFQLVDDKGIDITNGKLHYDPTVYTSDVRLYQANTPGQIPANLQEVSAKGTDTLNGLDFWYNNYSENKDGDTITKTQTDLGLYGAYKKKYQVQIVIDPSAAPTRADGIQLSVEAAHQTTNVDKLALSDITASVPYRTETTEDGKKIITYLIEDQTTNPATFNWTTHPNNNTITGNETFTLLLKQNGKDITNGYPVTIGNKYYSVSYDTGIVDGRNRFIDDTTDITTITHFINLTEAEYDDAIDPYDVLGEGAEYGIIADEYERKDHTETNFAVNKYFENTGAGIDLAANGGESEAMPYYIGEYNHIKFTGNTKVNPDIYTPSNRSSSYVHSKDNSDEAEDHIHQDGTGYDVTVIPTSKSDVNTYVNGLIQKLSSSSSTYAGKTTFKAPAGTVLDTTAFPDNVTIYVDATDLDIGQTGWEIKKLEGQSIVINKPGAAVDISKEYVSVYKKSEDGSLVPVIERMDSNTGGNGGDAQHNADVENYILNHIVINAYEATSVKFTNGPAGLFLAPNADFEEVNGSGTGWVATGKKFTQTGAEWHFFRTQRKYKAEGDFTLSGTKRIKQGETVKDLSEFSNLTFTFEVYECNENGDIAQGTKAIETVTADKTTGVFEFSKFKLEVPDKATETHYYVIKEKVEASQDGVTYDAKPVYVKVVATADGTVLNLAISTRASKEAEWSVPIEPKTSEEKKIYEIGNFDNTYEDQKGSLKIKKAVTENGAAPTSDVAKQALATTYEFTIYTDEDCTTPYKVDGQDQTVEITISADCADVTAEVTNLPVGDYWIKETDPANGSRPVTNKVKITVEADKVGDAAPVAEFTNNYETVSAQVKKVWEGSNNLPPSLSVTLYADDDATDHAVTLTANNDWTSEVISGLPKYKTTADGALVLDEQGNPVAIGYHWVEGSVPSGFFLTNAVDSDITNGKLTTLTNTYQEFSLTTSYIGTKTWKGASKPDSLTVELYANGRKTSHTPEWTNKETNVWTYEFKNLPVFDADGNAIKYTAVETLTGSYSQVTEETTSEETSYVQGTPDSESVKPCSDIHITLNAHTDLGYSIIKLTGNEGFVIWTHRVPTSSELNQINSEGANEFGDFIHKKKLYYSGVGHIDTPAGTIDVSFSETTKKLDVEFGGSSTWAWLVYGNFAGAQYNPGTTKFVNQFEDTFVEVDKQWLNPDGTAADWPEGVSVTVKLTADGTEVAGKTAVLDADHTSYKFENLPKYHENGTTQINYSVEEVKIAGYTSTVGDLTEERTITITNRKENVKKTLEATKSFNDWGKAESFTFELRPVNNAPMPEGTEEGVKTATATSEQVSASFGEITYEAAGTYVYTIKEVNDGIPGITYDTSEHRVVVTVSKVGTSEKLTADVKYDGASSLTIINKYASAKATLQAEKSFNDWGKAESFTFELRAKDGAPMPAGTEEGVKTATATSTNKTAVFGEIEYKAAGTYEYTITEVNDGVDGVSYDTTDHNVVVTVAKEGDNLVVDVKYDNKESLTITNTYTSVKKSIEVTKDFEDWGKATEFKFDLEAVTEDAPMPEGTVDGVKTATATQSDNPVSFGDITFEKAGTYEYTITEQNGGVDGVTYDTTAHSVTVTVNKAEDDTNALTAEVKYGESDSLTITNTFTAVQEELEATKEFNDWGKATSFTFELTALSASTPDGRSISPVPVPNGMTATATVDEPIASFGKINYEKAGTYTYKITEQNGGVDGVSYDTTPHTAVVTVSKDPETNALTASVEYDDGEESLIITNTYESAKATIEATKNFDSWGKATEFTFKLAAVSEGAPMPKDEEGNVVTEAIATESARLASFGEIEYEKAGVYEYTITEQNGGADGVTYDTTPHKVVVTVSKANDATNKLTAVVKYDDADSLTITNTYTSTKAELEATKKLDDWETADSFTFTLEAQGDAPMPADAEDGKKSVDVTEDVPLAKFGEITYEKAGVYEYTITEEKGDADGVTYDTTAHAAVVTVAKDPETNALSATVKYDGEDTLIITNTYASSNVELQATKNFADWGKADSFTFTLKPVSKDAPMPEGTNEAGEKTATATQAVTTARFGKIEYKKAGVYEYTITETDDGKDGVTYDTTPHKVVVTVTKDADNKLVAVAKYDDKDSLIITNTYEAAKASLEATKSFADWGKADSFTFDLEAVGDAPMPAGGKKSGIATMNAPVVNFGEITFEKAGEYNYTITEQNGGADGVTYDTTPHNVVVTVTKGEGNKLSAEVKYDDKDSLTITNTYAATKATIEATKEFEDWGKATEFKFDLAAVTEGAPMPSKTTASATEENPLASFGEIEYEKAGTYEYTITEQNGGADGVTYDTTAHKVKVVVTKANDATNKLTAAVTYDGADSLTITNTYEATKATLEATKDFADWGKATEFTFDLAAVTTGAPMPAKTSATATEQTPLASFGEITFEKAGTYEYTITEVNDGVDGVSYDTTAHRAVVTVSKAQGTNKLSASVKYDGKDSLIITNTFTAAEATLEATKSFNDWGKAESFTFDLAAVTEGAPMPEDTEAVATKENVNAVFGKVVYDKAGTYEYTITERNDGVDGVTYDTTAHKVKVEVTKEDDATNALTAKVTYDGADTLIVTNTYASTSVTLQATKEFSDWGKAASFTFDLAAVTEGAPMPANKVATATESAKTAVFGSIEYEKTGKYEYTITERNDGVDGVTYDTKAHKVVVNVTKDADNKMTAKATYDGKDNLIITNTFTAAKAHFETTKEFNDWGKAESFTFDLAAVTEGAPMPAETSATATKGKAAVFGDMEFDKAGTYEYTITEQNGGADGVSYDITPHNATVVVTKDAETNELSAEVTYDGEKSLIITNTFTAVQAHAEATKVLEGRDWFDADEFEFEIAAVTEGAPMPAEKTAKATKDAQTAIFGDMEFVKAGTYEYTITEKDGGIKGITYDTEPHSVTVTVSKAEDATNKLTAVVTYDGKDKLEITNKYASEGSVVLKVKKALNGRPLEDKQFTFELYDENGQPLQTATNDVNGIVEFAPIGYTNADITSWDAQAGTGNGTKKYTVKETIETKAGYTFDETELEITVTLTDNGDGTIVAVAAPELEDLVLTNGYKAEGEIVLNAQKKFISANELKEGMFTFELKDAEGTVIDSKTNAADGSVTFDAIKYTQDDIYKDKQTGEYKGAGTKTFTYTINEVIPEGAKDNGDGTYDYQGYTYDGTIYTVAVVLTDNGDGTISAVDAADAEKAKADEAEEAGEAGTGEAGAEKAAETESRYVFTNAYAAAGTLKLDAEKQFKNGTLKGGEFTFELKDADGNVMQSKTNDAAGNVSFDLITYQLADVANAPFTYTVSEVPGSRTDVKFDETVYTVTVELADNGDGTLKVTKKIDNGGALKFVNEQMNVETSITISGVKVLKGKDLKAGQFKFVMVDENGKWVDSAENDADGNFTFGTITYKLSDLGGEKKKVFTYGISEVKGSDRGIIYDEKVYTVVVTVTNNGDGTMTATADKSREDIKFVNTTRDKTGDEAPLGVLFGGLGFGAIGLAVLLEDRRRRNRSKE